MNESLCIPNLSHIWFLCWISGSNGFFLPTIEQKDVKKPYLFVLTLILGISPFLSFMEVYDYTKYSA